MCKGIYTYRYTCIHVFRRSPRTAALLLPWKDQLTELRKKETEAKHSFEMVSQSLADEIKFAKAALEKAKKRLGPELYIYIHTCSYVGMHIHSHYIYIYVLYLSSLSTYTDI